LTKSAPTIPSDTVHTPFTGEEENLH